MTPRKNQAFYRKMAALSMVLISESISATLIIPFVGLFVAHLYNVTPEESGYISGILVSVFHLGQMLTAKLWGQMSDRFGRKPMIELGLIFNAIASAFFGVSPSIEFCIFMRFLHGCANGNVLVAKTVIADITDKTNEGIGFSTISLFWGVGSIMGPMLGGLLYDPANNPALRRFFLLDEQMWNILKLHPAMLPVIVIAGFSLLTLVFTCAFLPETSKNAVDPLLSLCFQRKTDATIVEDAVEVCEKTRDFECTVEIFNVEEGDFSPGCKVGNASSWQSQRGGGARAVDETLQCGVSLEGNPVMTGMRNRKQVALEDADSENKIIPTFGYREALQSPSTRVVLLMYMCIASTECAVLEVFPLWAIASVETGGLGFTTSEVGAIMGAASIVCVIASLSFSTLLSWVKTSRVLWDFSVLMWALTCILTPCAVCLPSDWIFVYTIAVTSVREIGLTWAYALIFLYVSRSAPEAHVGSMSGIAQSIGSHSRMVTMMVLPPLFAWSLQSHGYFPFNHHFVFWVASLPLLTSYVLSSLLSPSVLSS